MPWQPIGPPAVGGYAPPAPPKPCIIPASLVSRDHGLTVLGGREWPVGLRVATGVGGEVRFYAVGVGRLVRLHGSPGALRREGVTQLEEERVLRLAADDPHQAVALYGQEMGACGICGSPLTNGVSRKRGVGPECHRRYLRDL